MTLRRALGGVFAAAAMFCGGQIVVDQPAGHADDGGYVLPDGAPAFIAGQGCETYTPSSQLANCADAQGCTYGLSCSSNTASSECANEARTMLPSGYPFFANCKGNPLADNGGWLCVFNNQIMQRSNCPYWKSQWVTATPFLACRTGSDGDAFCSAYLTQYVLGDGVAGARCITACEPADDFDGICATTSGAGGFALTPVGQPCGPTNDCEGVSMCVTRNGQSRCELPCAAP